MMPKTKKEKRSGSAAAAQVEKPEALQEAHAQLSATLNALPDLFFEIDRQGRIHDFRAPRPELLYLPPEQFLGRSLFEVIPKHAADVIGDSMAEAEKKGRCSGAVYTLDTPAGPGWFELSMAVKKGPRGKRDSRFIVLVRDVTDRVRAEEALRLSETRYRIIFETAGTAMVIFDDDGLITLANDEFSKMTGYSKEEVEGKMRWMDVVDPAQLDRMLAYHRLRSTDPAGAPRRYEARLKGRDGRLLDGVLTVEVISDTTERVVSFQDLSELKQAQEQMFRAEKMAALGQIVAGVAHEINNPNNFIYFNLPILRRYIEALRPYLDECRENHPDLQIMNMAYEAFMEDMGKLLENMEHGSRRISKIVEELKDYVRSHEQESRKPGQIEAVINRVMTLMGKQVRKMVTRFEVDVEEGLPPVLMDAGKIEQVVVNLLLNAAQASADKEDSRIRLTAGLRRDRGAVALCIEDNGVGIPGEHLHRIFEPFFTSKGRDAGTGLGLSISQRIIDDHGGRISVTSVPGEGSTFTVELPALRSVKTKRGSRKEVGP